MTMAMPHRNHQQSRHWCPCRRETRLSPQSTQCRERGQVANSMLPQKMPKVGRLIEQRWSSRIQEVRRIWRVLV